MSRFFLRSIAVAAAVGFGFTSDGALAAPAGIPDTAVDIDLKEASVGNVFKFLGGMSEREIVLDPCVHGAVDLRLQNTPLPLVFDALAMKLGLVYDDDNGTIKVGCKGDSNGTSERVSLVEKEAALPDVLQHLAASAKLEGVDYRAPAKPKVSVTVESVRLSTALKVLTETTNLNITVARKRLVVTE